MACDRRDPYAAGRARTIAALRGGPGAAVPAGARERRHGGGRPGVGMVQVQDTR